MIEILGADEIKLHADAELRRFGTTLSSFKDFIDLNLVTQAELSQTQLAALAGRIENLVVDATKILDKLRTQGYFLADDKKAVDQIVTLLRDAVKQALDSIQTIDPIPVAGLRTSFSEQVTVRDLALHRYFEARVPFQFHFNNTTPDRYATLHKEFNAMAASPAARIVPLFQDHARDLVTRFPQLRIVESSYNFSAADFAILQQAAVAAGWTRGFGRNTLHELYNQLNVPENKGVLEASELRRLRTMADRLQRANQFTLAAAVQRIIDLNETDRRNSIQQAYLGWQEGIEHHTRVGDSRESLVDFLARLRAGMRFANDAEKQAMLNTILLVQTDILPGIRKTIVLASYEDYDVVRGSDDEKELYLLQNGYLNDLIKELQGYRNNFIGTGETTINTEGLQQGYDQILRHSKKGALNHLVTMDWVNSDKKQIDSSQVDLGYALLTEQMIAEGGGTALMGKYLQSIKLLYDNGTYQKGAIMNLDEVTLNWEPAIKNLTSVNSLKYHDALTKEAIYPFVDAIRKRAAVEMLNNKSEWSASVAWSGPNKLFQLAHDYVYANEPAYKTFIDSFPELEREFLTQSRGKFKETLRNDAAAFMCEAAWYESTIHNDRRNAALIHKALRSSEKFDDGGPIAPDATMLDVAYSLNKTGAGPKATLGGGIFRLPEGILNGELRMVDVAPWVAGDPNLANIKLRVDSVDDDTYTKSALAQEKEWQQRITHYLKFVFGRKFKLERHQLNSLFITANIGDVLTLPKYASTKVPGSTRRTLRAASERDPQYVTKTLLTMQKGMNILLEKASTVFSIPLEFNSDKPQATRDAVEVIVNELGSAVAQAYAFPRSWTVEIHDINDIPLLPEAQALLKEHKEIMTRLIDFYVMGLFAQIPFNFEAVYGLGSIRGIGSVLNEQRKVYRRNVHLLETTLVKFAKNNKSFKIWNMNSVVIKAAHRWGKRHRRMAWHPTTELRYYNQDIQTQLDEGMWDKLTTDPAELYTYPEYPFAREVQAKK